MKKCILIIIVFFVTACSTLGVENTPLPTETQNTPTPRRTPEQTVSNTPEAIATINPTSTPIFSNRWGFLALNQDQLDWYTTNQELLRLPPERYHFILDEEYNPYGINYLSGMPIGERSFMLVGVLSKIVFPPLVGSPNFRAGDIGVLIPEAGNELEFGGEMITFELSEGAGGPRAIFLEDGYHETDENGNIDYFGQVVEYEIEVDVFSAFLKKHVQNGNLEGADIIFRLYYAHNGAISASYRKVLESVLDGIPGNIELLPNSERDLFLAFGVLFPIEVFETHPEMYQELRDITTIVRIHEKDIY